jgi:hypothetical protein
MALLENADLRKDMDCSVAPVSPALGFDLRFHAGFNATIPLRELEGQGNSLTILFRVTALDHEAEPTYLIERYHVPSISEDTRGEALLQGTIDLGEGRYHVDWMMRDRMERACTFHWEIEAALSAKDRDMKLALPPDTVQTAHVELFDEEPPVQRKPNGNPLKIKVMVNFSPQDPEAAAMRPQDTLALVSILRGLARAPEFADFTVVAFNIQEQRVIYRQDRGEEIDFPALGKALGSVKLGTVDASALQRKHGETQFLTELIQTEMGMADRPDAVVFAGPKVMLDASVPEEALKPLAQMDYPVFYMNYNLNPVAVPWRDTISRAIRVFRATEFTITRPRDVWFSLSDMMSRIVSFKSRAAQEPKAIR